MSFYNIRDIYNLKVGDAKAKAVLLCINHFINKDTKIAFPSIPTIAKYTEYSERTVYRCVKLLVDKNFLIKKKTHNHVNQYALALSISHPTPDSQSPKHTINIDNTRSNKNETTKNNMYNKKTNTTKSNKTSTNNKSKAEIHSITKTRNFFATKRYQKSSFFSDAYSSLKDRRES
jgi:hypothetical protein